MLPLFPFKCDVETNKFDPHIDAEEAKGVTLSCENTFRKNIVTCKDDHINDFLKEIDGLSLNTRLFSKHEELPFYIPILDDASKKLVDIPAEFPIVGVTLKDILAGGIKFRAGTYHERKKITFKKDFLLSNAFVNKKVILFLTGPDTLIEWIWYNREECNFFKTLKEMGFWLVSGFDFSIMEGECAFAQALNHKRSLYSSSLIEQSGLTALPLTYALNQFHIDRWLTWFELNPNINYFFVNCQLQKTDLDIKQVIISVKSILEKLNYVHVILQGFPFV